MTSLLSQELKLADFAYELPPGRIAQSPATPRDHSRLMVLNRTSPGWVHRRFSDIGDHLRPGDLLVLNATRVFPSRLRGLKPSGGKIELLLIQPYTRSPTAGKDPSESWRCLVRGASAVGCELVFPEGFAASLEGRLDNGEWVVRFPGGAVRDYLGRFGEMPLPPYIKRSTMDPADRDRYQTVFARQEGSIAAPTAGFHFTPELLASLQERGIQTVEIVLHVGWGTFRPVRTDQIKDHRMLPEGYEVSREAVSALTAARQEGRRIVAVGTTAVRTLESIYDPSSAAFREGSGETNLFIYPGYRFKAVDALVTNFHLSDSTPLLLACAFYASAPPFSLQSAYQEAIRAGYRFYSYGDAMFIQ